MTHPTTKRLFALFSSLALLAACAAPPRSLPAPDRDTYALAQVEGFEDIRFYGDESPPFLDRMISDLATLVRTQPGFGARIDMLALSGGAEDGAYGAGRC